MLCAQVLFHTTDPSQSDPDWILFQTEPSRLFTMKNWHPDLSPAAEDFILKLMHLDLEQRMSVRDALHHPWLAEGSAEVATRCDLHVMQRQRPLVGDDDSQSLPTSEGSRSMATAFTP